MNEVRHDPGPEADWRETWRFDFAASGMSGSAELTLWPNEKRAAVIVDLSRHGEPHLVVQEHEAPLPRGAVLEITTTGLWAAFHCETPLLHWTVGVEAFAVADPDAQDRGEIVPLGFDLEWEATEEPRPLDARQQSYTQTCAVTGEVLVASERITVDAAGSHLVLWGPAGDGDS